MCAVLLLRIQLQPACPLQLRCLCSVAVPLRAAAPSIHRLSTSIVTPIITTSTATPAPAPAATITAVTIAIAIAAVAAAVPAVVLLLLRLCSCYAHAMSSQLD